MLYLNIIMFCNKIILWGVWGVPVQFQGLQSPSSVPVLHGALCWQLVGDSPVREGGGGGTVPLAP